MPRGTKSRVQPDRRQSTCLQHRAGCRLAKMRIRSCVNADADIRLIAAPPAIGNLDHHITKNSYPLATVRILLGAARYRVDQFASLFPCSSMRGPRKDDAQSRVFTPTRTGRYAALRRTGTGASSTTVCAH